MKIRIDFVSNSSSCSFILSAPGGYLNRVVGAIADGCLAHADEDEKGPFMGKQDEFNRAVMAYHWRASECLFLGTMTAGYRRVKYEKGDNAFDAVAKDLSAQQICSGSGEKLVSRTDDAVEIDWPEYVSCPVVPTHDMDYLTGVYMFKDDEYDNTSKYGRAAEGIRKLLAESRGRLRESAMYFISRRTIWNTRALLASGAELSLDGWMDLDALDEKLKNGGALLALKINQGGDGVDDDSVYSFGGWDGLDAARAAADVEILYSETM